LSNNEDYLKECFQRLKRDAATGVDGVTVREYETNLKETSGNWWQG